MPEQTADELAREAKAAVIREQQFRGIKDWAAVLRLAAEYIEDLKARIAQLEAELEHRD